ncbi:Ceramide synthase 2 [Triplophysa tibetana]|uniref:Ceramide synthase 2 n=1 Tax=Triplophysa tibetana TaxID=1572043 RepID=A0A5A9P348_9TELE|nr:Ceramide synthase 2 [Triplophysa tibetana]
MLSEWFWWDRFWLPKNVTWADLQDGEGRVYARVSHLYIIIPVAVLLLGLRALYERLIAVPLAHTLGVKDKVRLRASHNPVLEKYYNTHSKHPTQKPWFYDLREVWAGYPKQSLLDSQYWYYIIEMSFYGSLLFSVAADIKRKDFKEQLVHHWATLTLLSFSWCANYIRIGTLVMLVHDTSDVLLESAKMFNYAGWKSTCNSIFVFFALVFMVTRLVIFPFWLIHCTWVSPLDHFEPFFGYYFFNVMLVVLLLLHVFWASLILRMVKKFLFGNLKGDERSDEEEDDEGTEEEQTHVHSNRYVTRLSNGH